MIDRVIGIDPSWDCSGIGTIGNNGMQMTRVPVGALSGKKSGLDVEEDLYHIQVMASRTFQTARDLCHPGEHVLWIFEGPSMGSVFGRPDERAGIRWAIANAARTQLAARIAYVPPSSLKKYWTGDGLAKKDKMVGYTAARYPELLIPDHNANDGFALAHMGATYLDLIPMSSPPMVTLSSLEKVRWPSHIAGGM